ncbi:ATP-binding cassette domain-containing protein [Metallosphaera hakonensis]|uniref:Mn2+/Zn2+ABC transporter ATP-binding protein n=1 Tax=Metallosphaera hakonensis JCM 8857 = DSM 7519 TaxID=1293036 RepID=A0A2U9IRA6_9CREN|nr:ATP-binding cassette domain-containing protein [Metallosphaera hakonensis]AWR98545.1 ATP-binding cassette domain-containing protein [Metallosphaera hakonensis JCM 8857 = DSM 7519]
MIELKNVRITLSRRGYERFDLENMNLKVNGEKVIILGPNGSGKTTLLKAISGLLPYSGSILINGIEVKKIRNCIEYSTNLPEAYEIGITVNDIVYLYEELKGLDRSLFLEMLKSLNLGEEILRRKLYVLSAGQSVLVRTSLALASRPEIFGLDVPFENVDAARRYVISRYIKEYGKEGILVTHELDMLSLFKDYKAYFLVSNKLQGPVTVLELLESSIVEGEREDALLTIDVMGKKISLVKGDSGMKFGALGSLNRNYGIINV